MSRKKVHEYLYHNLTYELEGTLAEAIVRLEKLREKYGDGVLIRYEQVPYEDNYELRLYKVRDETKEERQERLESEREVRERREGWEKQQYETLKKKFEKEKEADK